MNTPNISKWPDHQSITTGWEQTPPQQLADLLLPVPQLLDSEVTSKFETYR